MESPKGGAPQWLLPLPSLLLVGAPHLHEEGVAGVRGVARLEGVDDVGSLFDEGRLQLVHSQPVLVEAVVVPRRYSSK